MRPTLQLKIRECLTKGCGGWAKETVGMVTVNKRNDVRGNYDIEKALSNFGEIRWLCSHEENSF